MSDSESFISEVNDEVRRDRLYFMLRRYGWIAGLVVVLIVGGAAWTEYNKAQERATAEALGDRIIEALGADEPTTRLAVLENVDTPSAGAEAIVGFLKATEAEQAGDTDRAIEALDAVAVNGDTAPIYRQIAAFKSLVLQSETLDVASLRQQFEALAVPGAPLALLAQEQLALIDISQNQTDAAITKYQAILQDANVSSDLQQRALQVIVALGGTPELDGLPGVGN